ncbi:glyoxalase/bleomycin resistance protein/dioxygenase superfamily protein [Kribbella voronezhensis]|uniref:Glyoxalase/bleomycin resistance protein/dioxygenase superfamily protein n=1 Tax=Kribbella voronezhensis TaxID=2512212 RepID=A0A4R7T6P1_9ACTN|nr:VOC family protein [Kribbella voronezhensis]TDU86936.1 glyoxalase/bleomycin resistance protein/dioxygenase superfamily protein [Kribbella voronezhensis]
MNHFTGIRTVAVPVADQDRALDFYVHTLGFVTELDAPLPQLGGRWLVVAPPGGGTSIALIPATDAFPAGTDTGIRLATDDAAAAHAALTGQGVIADALLNWPGVPPMFTFYDPDHNKLFAGQS